MTDTIRSLRDTLLATVTPLLRGARRVALVDFPDYHNVGDSLLWLGALRLLRDCGIPRPAYVCSRSTYDPRSLERRLGDGMILMSGGGNFGDVWESHQAFRERVVSDFPHRPILQLPQSIHFQSEARLARAAAVLDAHPDLTLLVRDRQSLDTARAAFRAPAILCPDLAFAMGPLPRPRAPRRPVVWLSRRDKEKAPGGPVTIPPEVRAIDWARTPRTPATVLNRWLLKRLGRSPERYARFLDLFETSCRRTAGLRVERACRLLSDGRAVVTDRLHGHVLCMLLDIPHYLGDNAYGKTRGLHEAWTHASTRAILCDNEAEALARALRDVGSPGHDSPAASATH